MKAGDLVRVFYISDRDRIVDLSTGVIIEIDNEVLGKDNVIIFTKSGEVKEYSRNILSLQFEVISEAGRQG
tara:strand:- start:270 stop:482 length:213 start_codon:yes stop_codon:yes gene_type:complete